MAILGLLAMLVGLVNLGIFIYVLIKLFSDKGVLHGILGFLCGLYTFIWGWQNADRFDIKTWMWVWTACILLGIVLNVMTGGFNASTF